MSTRIARPQPLMHTAALPLLAALTACLLQACSSSKLPALETYAAPEAAVSQPAYQHLYYWAAHPNKHDPSDSTPQPYRGFTPDPTVDVFFLHPTTFTNPDAVKDKPYTTAYWNASINDAALNRQTDYSSILNQASPFNTFRVFAPRYRQAHILSFGLPDSVSRPLFDTAYADLARAFDYYLQHENGGRPFIIASHSQGTLHAGRLIKEKIEGKTLQNRMVAAYIIGLSVPQDYFSQCQPCANAVQTGCFVSWRTYRQGHVPDRVAAETKRSYVVNPITWTMDSLRTERSQHQGAVYYKFNKPKPHNVRTQVHGNVLWSTKPHFFGSLFFTRKNYHIGDINIFWKDIRSNAEQRVRAFWKR